MGIEFNLDDLINVVIKVLVDNGIIIVFLVGNLGLGELIIIGNFKKVFWVIIVVVGNK